MANEESRFPQWGQPQFNNSAGRLLTLVEILRHQKSGVVSHAVWRRVFVDPNTPNSAPIDNAGLARITDTLNSIYNTILEIEAEIRELEPEHHEMYLAEFPLLKRIFSAENLSASFGTSMELISGELVTNLRHCSRAMGNETIVEEKELHDVYTAACELFELVQTTSMHRKLKRALLSMIERVRQAIAQFQISGARGLDDALANLVGGLMIHEAEMIDIPNREQIGKGFGKVWTNLAVIAQRASQINTIADLSTKAVRLVDYLTDKA